MKEKSAIRSIIGGAKASRIGKDFEDALDITNRAYEAHGHVWMRKLPVPTVYIGNGLRRLSAKQGWDYYGLFGPNAGPKGNEGMYYGLAIAMEAKATEKSKASMPVTESTASGGGISYHQLKSLAHVIQDWGMVGVIVWMNGGDLMVLLPDDILAAKVMFDDKVRKSIPRDMFTAAEVVSYPNHPHVFDWLYVVRLWLEKNGLPSSSSSHIRAYDMILYRLDISRKTIQASDGVGGWREGVQTEVLDRTYLDGLARSSKSAEEFEQKVKDVRSANEN